MSVIIVCLLAVPAMADYEFDGFPVETRTNGTMNGSVFTDSVAWNDQTTLTLSTDVPNGNVTAAYLYTGIWGGSEASTGWVNVTFNSNYTANGLGPIHLEGENDNNNNVWCTGHGKYWWWYNVTNLTTAGQTNTATTSYINGSIDGRVYGIALVVVLENDSLSPIRYWVNDRGLNYVTPNDNGTTYFNGSVDTADVANADLTMVHLTAEISSCADCLQFNNNSLDTSMVDSNTFEMNTWNVTGHVAASGNNAWYSRDDDPYANVCNAILVLEEEGTVAPDLIVTDIEFPEVMRPDTGYTINATVKNQGNQDAGHFNVSLYVDTVLNGTVNVTAGLSAGSSTTVSFTPVNESYGCHEFKVVADIDNDVSESNENNNKTSEKYQVGYVIIVKSNSDFESLTSDSGLPSGSVTNVSGIYYIQNLTIENCAGKGISIENTDATFVIDNCTIKNCTGSGVYFHNLSYGTINGSSVKNSTKYGIEVGLVPLGSDDPEFVNITNNTIEENLYGVELICSNCTVDKNTILNNTDYGVYLLANDTSVTDNTITNSSDYGVKLYNSARNYVYCNTFTDNNAGNPGRQAWDNGTTNYWNTTDAGKNYTGNRWNDWQNNSGYPCNYTIDGGSNADKRPKGLYDFLTGAGTDKWAYLHQVSAKPPTTNDVPSDQFSLLNYVDIKLDDEERKVSTTDGDGYYAAHRFNFSIAEPVSKIARINVTWNGIGRYDKANPASNQGLHLYIWKDGTGYEEMADNAGVSADATLTGEVTTSISSYINAGNVTVLVVQSTAQDTTSQTYYSHVETDYVRVVVAP